MKIFLEWRRTHLKKNLIFFDFSDLQMNTIPTDKFMYFYNGTMCPMINSKKGHEFSKKQVLEKYPKDNSLIQDYKDQLNIIEKRWIDIAEKEKNPMLITTKKPDYKGFENDCIIWIMNIIYMVEVAKLPQNDKFGYLYIAKGILPHKKQEKPLTGKQKRQMKRDAKKTQ